MGKSESMPRPDVLTTRRLPFDHLTVASGRQEWLEHGRLLLVPQKCECRDHPSALGTDLVQRLADMARRPETWYGAPADHALGQLEGQKTLERLAFEEAAAMLGTYIRRLEDTCTQYAQHLEQEHGQR